MKVSYWIAFNFHRNLSLPFEITTPMRHPELVEGSVGLLQESWHYHESTTYAAVDHLGSAV